MLGKCLHHPSPLGKFFFGDYTSMSPKRQRSVPNKREGFEKPNLHCARIILHARPNFGVEQSLAGALGPDHSAKTASPFRKAGGLMLYRASSLARGSNWSPSDVMNTESHVAPASSKPTFDDSDHDDAFCTGHSKIKDRDPCGVRILSVPTRLTI